MPRAILIGQVEESVRDLLTDTLAEIHVDVHVEPRAAPFDLVIGFLTSESLARVLSAAHTLAAQAPVLVVMPMWDEECEEVVLRLGAKAYWALEWPLGRLTATVSALVDRRTRGDA